MAFADMFAPMRNFGATAAATTQAEAARMGAEASRSRAKTAESLAPWNMAATAVQGVGTLGGLAQKFMEMGQMAPQREAMTDYYKAQTDRLSGPLAHQGNVLKIKAGALTRSNQLNAEGKPFNIRNAQDEIKMAVGARKVPGPPFQPSATGEPILGMGGPMQDPAAAILGQPATWDWGDVDPSVRAFAEHHADTLPDWLAQDDAAKLKDVKSYHEAVLSTKIFGAEALKKAQEEFGPDMTAKMQQINMYAGMWEKLQGMGLPAATPAVMGVLQGIDEMSQGFPGRKSPLSKDVLKRLQNLGVAYETQRKAGAGIGVPVDMDDLALIEQQQQLGQVAGDANPQEEALKFIRSQEAIGRGETGEATDPAHQFMIRKAETPVQRGAVTQADGRRQDIADEVWGSMGSVEETTAKMNIVKKRFPYLLKELGDGKIDPRLTGSRQKLLVIDMLRLRAGHSPFQARNLWKNHLDVAAGLSGLTGEAREAFKQKITHNLNRMSSAFGPIAEGISQEDIATKGGVGQVPHATQGDIMRQRGWGGEGIGGWLGEAGATAMSGFGIVAGGGYGGNRQQLEAFADLLREPGGGRGITPVELKGLFKVGGTTGALTFDDTFYRTTDLVSWEIDNNLKAHVDENEGAGLDFWQAAEDIASHAIQIPLAAGKLLPAVSKVPVVSGLTKAAGKKLRPVREGLFKLLGAEAQAGKGFTALEKSGAAMQHLTAAERQALGITEHAPEFFRQLLGRTGGAYKPLMKTLKRPSPYLYEELLRRGSGPRGLDWHGSPAERPLGE